MTSKHSSPQKVIWSHIFSKQVEDLGQGFLYSSYKPASPVTPGLVTHAGRLRQFGKHSISSGGGWEVGTKD